MRRREFLSLIALGGAFPFSSRANFLGTKSGHEIFPGAHQSSSTANEESWPKISLIACGGAGIAMSRQIDRTKYGLHEIIAIDTSDRMLRSATHADRTLLIRADDGKKPDSADGAWHWAGERWNEFLDVIGNPHMAIIVTGLGGSAGTGIANIVSQSAKARGIFTLVFATTPFGFEDAYRQTNSLGGFIGLTDYSDNATAVSNERLVEALGPTATVKDVLRESNFALEQYLWNTSGCLARQGMVGMDIEDIRTTLTSENHWSKRCSSTIGWGASSGINRALTASKQAIGHPLLRSNNEGEIRGVSVSIRASQNNLRIKEINTVMTEVKTSCCGDNTHVIFSADYDESLNEEMQVSLILNRDLYPQID